MKKQLNRIANIEQDFDQWYTDVVKQSGLMDYGLVKGTMIIKPYGWAIWENIKTILDQKFAQEGVENLALPFFIPQQLIAKEKDHIEGFSPEILKVTHCGDNKLDEPFYIRPTSEVLFMELFRKEVTSYKGLPLLYNQWCSVVRWEKRTRPFLRSSEFFWQEGHTVHATSKEAKNLTTKILHHYQTFCNQYLAMPVFSGKKTENEKFAGALQTFTVEAMMKNGKALQAATSHFFGNKFAQSFDIKFQNKDNKMEFAYTTSWGISTRIIGGIIMTHGDEKGLVLPPKIAPIQIMLLPLLLGKESDQNVIAYTKKIATSLKDLKCKVDWSDKSLGFKSANAEIKGVPIRIEIGPRDVKNQKVVVAIRHNDEKYELEFNQNLLGHLQEKLKQIQEAMLNKANDIKTQKTKVVTSFQELKAQVKKGYALGSWCFNEKCEAKIKDQTNATTRCIFDEIKSDEKCVGCNNKALGKVYFALAY